MSPTITASPNLHLRSARVLAALSATATLWFAQDASAACPLDESPVTCVRYSDRLVVQSAAGDLVLRGEWSRRDELGRFRTTSPFTMAVAGGIQIPVPGVSEVTVTCSPYLSIAGTVTSLPDLGLTWPGTSVETSLPSIQMGMALGEQLSGLDVPVEACRPYFYFALQSSASYSFAGLEAGVIDGDDIKFLLDPMDPGFIFEVGGPRLGDVTGGFVNRAGFGLSRSGRIAWESALDLPTGFGADAGAEVVDISGHVWATGKFGLIPIPNLPVQLTLDGDTVVNLGNLPKAADETLAALLSGDAADLPNIIRDEYSGLSLQQVMNRISIGGNLNSLALTMEFFSLDFARGSIVLQDGKLRIAAETWTPGEGIAPGGAGFPLLDAALSAVVVKVRGEASGYVDKNGYRFELGGNFTVGPLTINNGKLIIDSSEGISVERGDLKFDPIAFVEQMKTIFHCDFASGLATCKVGGFKVLSANASIQNGNVKMGVKLDLLGLSSAEFSLVKAANGEFRFVLQLDRVPSFFGFGLLSAKLIISKSGVSLDAKVDRVMSGETFSGRIWKAQGQVRWDLSFQGTTSFFNLPNTRVKAAFSNTTGVVRMSLEAAIKPSQIDVHLTGSDLVLKGEVATDGKYLISGRGGLVIGGYPLTNLDVSLSNQSGPHVFSLAGNFDAQVVHIRLAGSFTSGSSDFVLTGSSDLNVHGYSLVATSFSLTATGGLTLSSQLDLGGLTLGATGLVSPTGDVTLTAAASVSIPVDAGLTEIIQAGYCVQKTIQAAGQCAGEYISTTIQEFGRNIDCGLEEMMQCTEEVVHQAAEWVKDGALCGFETINCGMQYVRDGAKCGFDILAEKVPQAFGCAGDMIECVFTGRVRGEYCHPEWAPPASCLAVAEPRFCYVDMGVCEAKSCEKVTTWTTPSVCYQVGSQYAECWHNVTIQTPKVCNEIVATECYPDVTSTVQRTLGYFNGTVALTFGTTLGASVTGSYCDIWGSCRSWGLAGSVDLLQSGGGVCIDIATDAFPAGAIFRFFSPSGVPRFCL